MTETVAIVDYGSGNLRSVEKALARAARESGLGAAITVTGDAHAVAAADRVVLPGVGAFAATMAGLRDVDGMIAALEHAALVNARPFLGICVGMQLLAERGEEFGESAGLGWLPGVVKRLQPEDSSLRIPHVGWNSVRARAPHPALQSLGEAARDFYFTHSYTFDAANDAHVLGVAAYGGRFAAIVGRDNLLAFQFHPEKSQAAGVALLTDFLRWNP